MGEPRALDQTRTKQASPADTSVTAAESGFSWWLVAFGAVLVIGNVYWVIRMEALPGLAYPTDVAIFFNAVFSLFVLVGLNHLVRLISPRLALKQSQLLLLYSMISFGSALAGNTTLQWLVPVMTWSFWAATPANNWDNLINPDLPRFATVSDPHILRGFYEGGVSPYQTEIIGAWAGPIAAWTVFVLALFTVMICLNVLVRRRWLDDEHISCPLVYLPVEISHPRGRLLRNKLFWVGFAGGASINIWNRLAFYYPAVPQLHINGLGSGNMAAHLTNPPWNAIKLLPRSFHPFIIGLGYFMPSDFLFSLWFFYLFWKAQLVGGAAMGIARIPGFPFDHFQCLGAYVMFACYTLWLERDYLREVYQTVVGQSTRLSREEGATSYRLAAGGIAVGAFVLIWFSSAIGMHLPIILGFFGIYYILAVSITRMRAQFGVPFHSVHGASAGHALPKGLGTANIAKQDLIGLAMSSAFNRDYRAHPMPFHMEAMKMQQTTGGTVRGTTLALVVAGFVSTLAIFWAFLHLCYALGATAKGGLDIWGGDLTYNALSDWLTVKEGMHIGPMVAMFVGGTFVWFLYTMHLRLVSWPFHPLAYAISASAQGQFMINYVWMPLFIAWVIKTNITRYGGHRAYQMCVPIFMGIIVGEFIAGSTGNLLAFAFGWARRFALFVP